MSIGIKDGKIVEVSQAQDLPAHESFDAAGNLVSTPFVDSHFHMDSTLSLGQPRLNQNGTLLEGIQIWNELKPDLNAEHIKKRALDMAVDVAHMGLHVGQMTGVAEMQASFKSVTENGAKTMNLQGHARLKPYVCVVTD